MSVSASPSVEWLWHVFVCSSLCHRMGAPCGLTSPLVQTAAWQAQAFITCAGSLREHFGGATLARVFVATASPHVAAAWLPPWRRPLALARPAATDTHEEGQCMYRLEVEAGMRFPGFGGSNIASPSGLPGHDALPQPRCLPRGMHDGGTPPKLQSPNVAAARARRRGGGCFTAAAAHPGEEGD